MKGSKKAKERKVPKNMRITLQEIGGLDLRGRMRLMAEVAQDLMRDGKDGVFLVAIMRGEEVIFVSSEPMDDEHLIAMQSLAIDSAIKLGADCLVTAFEGWLAPGYSQVPPTLHPERKHVLITCGKDQWEHLVGVQEVFRHGKQIVFDDLEISEPRWSWLDWYPALNQAVACC